MLKTPVSCKTLRIEEHDVAKTKKEKTNPQAGTLQMMSNCQSSTKAKTPVPKIVKQIKQ
jgi:hypothetical protein